ncbi:hypothetical protein [Rhizobium sp. BR 314]|uniref:hypothetical protein n=1 Tax=Rhizobium sp. BR 314 TaxID=3040013 RepID=UPI0039BFB99C
MEVATPAICMQAFRASAVGTSIIAVTAYFRLETWQGPVNKPVLSIILQTRYALLTASSAAIAPLATTKIAATAKNRFIENPVPRNGTLPEPVSPCKTCCADLRRLFENTTQIEAARSLK